ncbi:MAG: hypothetical protein K6A34_04400 [Methanobrevibacter sp.]|nr:hypothetical protein [Methanobrevibacter sp.]
MDNCPNCTNEICANGAMTQMFDAFDKMFDSNPLEMQRVDESFINGGFLVSNEYPDKLRKPRKIPTVIPKRLPDIGDFDFFDKESFLSITVTCKRSPWIFHYSQSMVDIEVLDN